MDIGELVNLYVSSGYELADALAKVSQDIILLKISRSSLNNHVTIKGGVVMHNISKDKRRATRDMDFDFIKYSLSDESIKQFIEKLNNVNDGINININGKIEFEKSKGILQSWSNETLDNRLFLSEIVNNRKCTVKEVLDVYNWITQTLSIKDTRRMNDSFSLTKILEGDGADIVKLMKTADLGLEDISVKETPIEEIVAEKEKIKDKLKATLLNILTNGKGKALEAKSFHRTEDGQIKSFDFNSMESLGTKKFLTLSGYLLEALKKGKVFVVDELDNSLHPYLVKNLISLFNDPNVNKNNAQLIFMSHAHYLMDGEHLSRDQIWLTSKELNKGFYSDLYSLSDFKNLNRKNAAFYNAYMEGIYGAVPFWEKNND